MSDPCCKCCSLHRKQGETSTKRSLLVSIRCPPCIPTIAFYLSMRSARWQRQCSGAVALFEHRKRKPQGLFCFFEIRTQGMSIMVRRKRRRRLSTRGKEFVCVVCDARREGSEKSTTVYCYMYYTLQYLLRRGSTCERYYKSLLLAWPGVTQNSEIKSIILSKIKSFCGTENLISNACVTNPRIWR